MNSQLCLEKNLEKNLSGYGDILVTPYNFTGSQELWKDLKTEDYIMIFATIVLIIGGLLGNASVILTVILNKSMRTTINFYIANLALADAMICIICMIPHALLVATTKSSYIFGKFMCKITNFTQMTCLISSVLTLSAISFDRFLVVVFSTRMMGVKQRTALVISIIWIISAAVSTPLLFFKMLIYLQYKNFLYNECGEYWPVSWYYDETTGKCDHHAPLRDSYYVIICTALYFLPMVVMISAYSMIVWTVRTRPGVQLTRPSEQYIHSGEDRNTRDNVLSRTNRKVNKMVLFVLIAFFTCWTPFLAVIMFSAVYQKGIPIPIWFPEVKWTSYYLAYANSFINPIIYGGFNKTFRDGFCDILRCGFTKSRLRRLAISIRTFTTRFTSSRTRRLSRTPNEDRKNSHKYNMEMKTMLPVVNGDISPSAKGTCVAIAETRDKEVV